MGDEKRTVGVGGLLLITLLALVAIGIPLLGVWTASSLAAFHNGNVWLVCLAGLLLFPILPVLWELRAQAKRRARGRTGPTTLTAWDRIVFRTLFLNVLFLGVLLWRFPADAFAALQTRGDWFLEGRNGPGAERLRADLFTVAGRLEWLYSRARQNRFEKDLDPSAAGLPEMPPRPVPVQPLAPEAADAKSAGTKSGMSFNRDGTPAWPVPATLHPAVAALRADEETDYRAVARRLAEGETNPWLRLKALHDWVADRVAYDVAGLRSGTYPPQDPETVFRTRKAVCAGYARLLAAMAESVGEEVRVVSGDARLSGRDLTGEGHAWNVARIGLGWVLLDATWNAGSVSAEGFTKEYETTWLFTPAEVFGVTHFPEEPSWQLLPTALSRGDFFRQPMLRAGFFAEGLELLAPDRSQVTVDERVDLRLRNPNGRFLMAKLEPREGGAAVECAVGEGPEPTVDCRVPGPGAYRLALYASRQKYGRYPLVGEIEVLSRG